MRLLNLEYVNIGDKIAKPIYDSKLKLLVNAGIKITESLKRKMIEANVSYVYIDDEISEGIEIESLVADEEKLRAIGILKEIEAELTNDKNPSPQISDYLVKELKDLIDAFIDYIYMNRTIKYFSTELMSVDMYTFNHNIEVAILALKIGHQMSLDRQNLMKLGVGAILADIGKLRVPKEIVNKKGKLTPDEFKEMQRHVNHGYNYIKSSVNVAPQTKQIVLLHHEKLDGSGYPERFVANQIPLLVRIVTVCDIFDAIASDRTYSQRNSIGSTLKILRSAAGLKLDQNVVSAISNVIEAYPPGTIVKLTNGKIAIVVKNTGSIARPIVRIIENKKAIKDLNLMTDLTLFIEEVLPKLPEETK